MNDFWDDDEDNSKLKIHINHSAHLHLKVFFCENKNVVFFCDLIDKDYCVDFIMVTNLQCTTVDAGKLLAINLLRKKLAFINNYLNLIEGKPASAQEGLVDVAE